MSALVGIAVGIYRISESLSIFRFSYNIHVYIVYNHCAKDQIKNQNPKLLISRFKCIHYDYFNSCSIFKTPITQIAKSPVLRTGGNDNSKFRYGNELKIVMTFINM